MWFPRYVSGRGSQGMLVGVVPNDVLVGITFSEFPTGCVVE